MPQELDLHSLRHSYVTHLTEFDYPERFVQDQVGHAFASTTSIYSHVSDEYRNRLLSEALTKRGIAVGEDQQRSRRWVIRLRALMAQRELYQTTDLVPLLAKRGVVVSREQVFRLVTQPPQRLSMDVLAALCDILECLPNDLIEIEAVNQSVKKAAGDQPHAVPKVLRTIHRDALRIR